MKIQNLKLKIQNYFLRYFFILGCIIWVFYSLFFNINLAPSDVIYNADNNVKTLFSDVKAYKVGDLLTILIAESTTAGNTAQTKTGKDFNFKVDANNSNGKKGVFDFLEQIGLSKDESFTGGGKTTRTGFFTAKLTVKVVEILENGNLKIEGSQELLVNNEKQIIKISGIVRPVDITKDNTVYSTYIADAKITYEGKGPLAKKQKEGFFSKLFNWLF